MKAEKKKKGPSTRVNKIAMARVWSKKLTTLNFWIRLPTQDMKVVVRPRLVTATPMEMLPKLHNPAEDTPTSMPKFHHPDCGSCTTLACTLGYNIKIELFTAELLRN
ncbi:hypothetical protein PoB_005222400 [Plakobranchus ocellatus]|uniref:Uncharacterized protein n=1 Tax=Plakobranchus ocellatus TaxID=259542 RepID=A0AAV4C3L8_9GAST|nr:hypothetical protein PoB_005222400 [Plakobranchus ocellatus]